MKYTESKRRPILSTILYLLLLPLVLWMALLWGASADPSSIWDFLTLFTWFWVPISIPLSIYFTWSKRCNKRFKNFRLFNLLPLLAFGAFILANVIIEVLEKLFT